MAQRQTLNVSLPQALEQFVRAQVESGRYRTASEVVRDALRLLEEAEHRRLVEKWLFEDLTDEESAALPADLKERVQAYFRTLVAEGLRSAEEDGWVDGPKALAEMRQRLAARREDAS